MAPFRLCFASVLCALGFSSKLAFSACPNDFSIEMWVALPIKDESENLRKLDDLFWKVSDIASEQYGQYLSAEELQSYMKTEPQVIQRVASHFEKHGVSCGDWYRFGDALKCEGRCNAIQEALGVGASLYLPLGHHGEVVTATIHNWNARHAALQDVLFIDFQMFGSGQIWSTVSEVLMKVDNPVTVPETIFNVYNIPDRLQGDPSIVQAPVEFFQGNITLTGIVNESVSDWIVQAASDPFDVYYRVNLTGVPPRGALEASLDVEYLGGVGRGMTNQYIITTHWFYGFAKELLSECDIPDVLSISFGTEENHACAFKSGSAECAEHGWNNTQYMYYTNLQYQALALRGVTVAVSSGDHGAEVIGGAGMKNVSNPTYLTSSPYVTSVGGTQFVNPVNTGLKAPACHTGEFMCLSSGDEIVASVETGSQITTGGGFSFASARSLAPYQERVVEEYLRNPDANLPPPDIFDRNGRGYPDISAIADSLLVEVNPGVLTLVGGTSASAPIIAGIFALISADRIQRGLPVLGFLNPLLYKIYEREPDAFNDITVGRNNCVVPGYCDYGYSATEGWDAATGLGTPNVAKILKAIRKLDEEYSDTWLVSSSPEKETPSLVSS